MEEDHRVPEEPPFKGGDRLTSEGVALVVGAGLILIGLCAMTTPEGFHNGLTMSSVGLLVEVAIIWWLRHGNRDDQE